MPCCKFVTIQQLWVTKIEDKLVEVKGKRVLFRRCAVVANSNGDQDMKSVATMNLM